MMSVEAEHRPAVLSLFTSTAQRSERFNILRQHHSLFPIVAVSDVEITDSSESVKTE